MTVATGYPDRLFGGAIRNEPAMTLDATTVAAAIALAILGIAWTGVALARRSGLRRLLRTLDGVSRGASLAMIAWHPRAGVLLWSEGAERLLGLERAQALGRPLPQGLAGLQRLGRDEVERHPLLLQRADGGSVKASVSWQDAPGQPGVRIATSIAIGTATIAAFVGAGGYGERIVTGLALNDRQLLLAGAIPAALLALASELVFGLAERRLARRQP